MSDNIKIEDLSTIKINNTTYSIEKDWLDIGKKYLDINPTDVSAVNLLKSGFFGYFNEIASNEIKNNVYYKNFLYDEHFLNSASAPESIFNFARLYNIEIINAYPSHLKAILNFKKSYIIKFAKEIEETDTYNLINYNNIIKNYQFIIDKNISFGIENYSFLLPYNINIIIKEKVLESDNSKYSISALYDIKNDKFPFIDLNNPYLNLWEEKIDNEDYLFITVDLYQLEKNEKNILISDDEEEEVFDNYKYKVTYNDQLAYFNVYYIYDNEKILLNKYFNNTYTPNDEKYCYYNYLDDNTFEISFTNLFGGFKPKNNSELLIEYYTTLGSKGNFEYSGELNYNISDDLSFENIPIGSYIISNPTNGKDRLDINEVKNTIIKKVTTRDNLITDNDLNYFFDNINKNNNINNGKITFLKSQDDILRRMYNSFILLRDSNNKIIPTNTLKSLTFNVNDLNNSNNYHENDYLIIPDNSIFLLDYESKDNNEMTLKMLNDSELEEFNENLQNDNDIFNGNFDNNTYEKLYYTNPFLIKCNLKNNILYTNYFNMYINKNFKMSYNFVNNFSNNNIIINEINISKKNNLYFNTNTGKYSYDKNNDTYEITTTVNINNNIDNISKIQLIGKLKSKNNNTIYGYFLFNRDEKYNNLVETSLNLFNYTAHLSTKKEFENNKLVIYNSLINEKNGEIINTAIDEDLDIEIAILYGTPLDSEGNEIIENDEEFEEDKNLFEATKTSYINDNTYNSFIINSNLHFTTNYYEENEYNENDIYFNKDSYIILNTFINTDSITLYKDITNLISSDFDLIENLCTLKMLPVVGLKYYLRKSDEIYDLLEKYFIIMKDASNNLQNNTSINMKFYNTFGPSYYYYINDEYYSKENNEFMKQEYLINRTDITLNMDIYLNEPMENYMKDAIVKFISNFIEETNENNSDTIAISNLVRSLENNFNIIKYIKFNGISDYHNTKLVTGQVIKNTFTGIDSLSKQEIIEFVPEYINLRKNITDIINSNDSNDLFNITNTNYDYVIQLKLFYN